MARLKLAPSFLTALTTLALITTACPAPAEAIFPANATLQLPAFTAIRSCLPFTFLILPPNSNATNTSTATITADANVINATVLTVDIYGVLVLTVQHGFKTNNAIKLTVVPATTSSLEYLDNSGPGDLILGPGSNSTNLNVASSGNANLLGYNISAAGFSIANSGTGTILLNGSLGSGGVITSGNGKVYLIGSVSGSVQIDASGISSVLVEGTPSAILQGYVQGLSKVFYTQGSCYVQAQYASLNVFGDPCQRVAPPNDLGFHPVWSCGLVVDGSSTCAVPTGNIPQLAATPIPWLNSDGSVFVSPPPPQQVPTTQATSGSMNPRTYFIPSNNNNGVYSSSSGGNGLSFSSSSSSSSGGGGGGSSITSTSRNGGPAVVTINGQVVSPDGGASQNQGQSQGLSQNSNGLAVASITCLDLNPGQVLDQ